MLSLFVMLTIFEVSIEDERVYVIQNIELLPNRLYTEELSIFCYFMSH